MLTLSTNLMLWMTAVTEESLHQTVLPTPENTSRASQSMAMRGELQCSQATRVEGSHGTVQI